MNATYVEEFRTRIYNIFVDIRKFLYRLNLIRNKYVTQGMDSRAASEARERAFPEVRDFILKEADKIRKYVEESEDLAKSIKAKRISGLLGSIKSMLDIIINNTSRGEYPGPDIDTLRSFTVMTPKTLQNRIESYVESLY